ncbi:MAG TPA: hypothetical protein VMU43_07530 [Candidatus Acidoferrum sp.]|nr:hypothetical protein [Candidatus Acidoferrum sp.]
MRGKIVLAGLVLALCGTGAMAASSQVATTTQGDIYCSGVITTASIPQDTFIITGEGSDYKVTFQEGSYVYINKGASQGVKVGDVYSVIRAVKDPIQIEWSKWTYSILRQLGTKWEDEGRVRVVVVHGNTSIGQIEDSCNYMQRGDILIPFEVRATPERKPASSFDRFAPPSGKAMAMIVAGKGIQVQFGANDIVYVNLGSAQGVKVGDYFRIFRYTGTQHETAYQTPRFAFDADGYLGPTGFGVVPKKYNWTNVPREVVGEGVVLRTGTNSATVLVTFTVDEVYVGNYVEIE